MGVLTREEEPGAYGLFQTCPPRRDLDPGATVRDAIKLLQSRYGPGWGPAARLWPEALWDVVLRADAWKGYGVV